MTCARARQFNDQALGNAFFQLEHSKLFFKGHDILAFKNLYSYHTFMEVFKILKLECPTALHQHFTLSKRKNATLISQLPSQDFISRSTKLWNIIAPKIGLFDYSYKISLARYCLKRALLKLQHASGCTNWTSNDYDVTKLSSSQLSICVCLQ
jgi:hypothetical protein